MRFRTTLVTGLAAVTALALAGCTGGTAPAGDAGPVDTDGELSGTVQFQTWSLKNEKFTPYFEKLIAAFEDPANARKGVITLEGKMVERLHLVMARRTVAIADGIEAMRRTQEEWF